MALIDDITGAVNAALRRDGKIPDPSQVMQNAPYEFNTDTLMRDFLLEVNHELNKTGQQLDVDSPNLSRAQCMSDTVDQLCGDILNAMSA
jgi:hypothetical protein